MDICPSEAETFWAPFLPKLVRRGLRGIKLVVCDAHAGVKATVRKGRQHRLAALPRALHAKHTLAHAGESRPRVVAAFIATAFAQDDAETTTAQWCKVAEACRNLGIRHVRARALPAQNQRKGRAHEPAPLRDTTVSVFLRVAKHSCRMIVGHQAKLGEFRHRHRSRKFLRLMATDPARLGGAGLAEDPENAVSPSRPAETSFGSPRHPALRSWKSNVEPDERSADLSERPFYSFLRKLTIGQLAKHDVLLRQMMPQPAKRHEI